MSSPTPGSDPNLPQGGAPQGQPGWSAPPPPPAQGYGVQNPQGYGSAPAYSGGPAAPGQRPGKVTAAAIIGIVIGGLGTLFGLIGLLALGIVFAFGPILGLLLLLSHRRPAVVVLDRRHPGDPGQVAASAAPGQLRLDRRPAAVPVIWWPSVEGASS